jgi:hypothetical protein
MYFGLLNPQLQVWARFVSRLHPFSEDIYNWVQLAAGYRLTELKSKRDSCLEILNDYKNRFDTAFGEVITFAMKAFILS